MKPTNEELIQELREKRPLSFMEFNEIRIRLQGRLDVLERFHLNSQFIYCDCINAKPVKNCPIYEEIKKIKEVLS